MVTVVAAAAGEVVAAGVAVEEVAAAAEEEAVVGHTLHLVLLLSEASYSVVKSNFAKNCFLPR